MIRLENISKKYPNFSLVDINLEIHAGEYFVILGPSGSGKTLLLEIIAGLIPPDSGSISGMKNMKCGLIYQDYMLFPHLNVTQNIGYGLRIRKEDKNQIQLFVENAARDLEISHLLDRSVNTLSGGEKQRVAIARAMVLKPEVYLFDEPTAALDLSTRTHTQKLFLMLHKELQSTVIHVTHDFEEALSLGDRIALIFDGRIIQVDKAAEIFNNPATKSAAAFLGYKNVFSGEIKNYSMSINGIEITTLVPQSSFSHVAIRSNDIILSKEKIQSSARNAFLGEIFKVIQRGNYVEVILDIGVHLHVGITHQSCQEMDIREGSRLWATFKTSSVKVYEH
ncbi:MAG: ABC transporter ATP-binding protein [Candidatus Aminicenantes bacterium]|nr:ABC transporter ATP-binding protein [Candidatus Aminicenantes bacterium]